ncbi:hypothetical protein M404DRAFT_1004664 [Pisolithus tinctorius Marx 270]|uniref:Uncharacterized protein n=1 Tax=Pisolithus tinctorius Marx 270 TaxID=870435 RepID=A0A0C3NE56_PISTI|nr:hypothetical protein M404DRAFT_1004664 [Pisolithus tinctorius Marx 270]
MQSRKGESKQVMYVRSMSHVRACSELRSRYHTHMAIGNAETAEHIQLRIYSGKRRTC